MNIHTHAYIFIHTQARRMSIVYPMTRRRHTHTLSLYICIHTHTGKTYENRVPDDEAQAWLDALLFTVKEAKAKTSRSIFREKYGHSAYSMMRAREADQEEGGGRRLY